MRSIKILGENKEFLSIELKDVLNCIADGDKLKWSILFLEAIGDIGKSMTDFEKEIVNSKDGIIIEWKDLLDFSKILTLEIVR